MWYKDNPCEIIGQKEVFGQQIAWIRLLDSGEFREVPLEEVEDRQVSCSMPFIQYVAIAAKIKDEMARKNILAPYESSLIPLPHQILVLEKVIKSGHNRFLLADEVGMGKTIETGLILKELKIRDEIKRILVIVPKSSMMQWQSELKEHFNEVFHLYDSEMITSMARTFANINADEEYNFWKQHNQIIVSTDALKPLERRQGWPQERIDEYNLYRMDAVLDADFDLVIIDEAHKMGGAKSLVSRYVLAQELCNTVPNVLLLTATPHRGKSDHFRRILQLLDPDAFAGEGLPEIYELEPYVIRTEKRLGVDYEGNRLFNHRTTNRFDVFLDIKRHQKQMQLYQAVTEYVRQGFNASKRTSNKATGLIMILFQRLVSSSTQAILSAMQGRLNRLQAWEQSQPGDFEIDVDEASDFEDWETVNLDGIYQRDHQEWEDEEEQLQKLIDHAQDCLNTETDAKTEALLKKLEELQQLENDRNLKILVFTEFRSTQKMLVTFFRNRGYSVSHIHGSQDLDERKRALSDFRQKSQLLIATDAAGESLNMQFCHIVFNYDLPWNPMMIEQRIGRVDRIGQKSPVLAFNMLTDNSVDARVYEVIEEKLSNILQQLGIDKTSDVLDSAIDMKKVNGLYLQSLLDPEKFEFAGDRWLHEIRKKLKDFKSTEGILPQIQEKDIDFKKAAEIKHSPLPYWLEALVTQNVILNKGSFRKNEQGYTEITLKNENIKVTYDAEIAVNNPEVEHLTLQNGWVKSLLNQLTDFDFAAGIPVIRSENGEDTPGYWSLWQVSARNSMEQSIHYQSFFHADNGRQYAVYANDIWNRLLDPHSAFRFITIEKNLQTQHLLEVSGVALHEVFQRAVAEMTVASEVKKENRKKAFLAQKLRVQIIGIENIRNSKMNRLEKEYQDWLRDFESNRKIIPGMKNLIIVRVDG